MSAWPSLLPSFVLAAVATAVGAAPAAAAAPPPHRPSASIEGYYYYLPASADAMLGIGSIDIGRAHLEARYNYENLRTGSAFVGHGFDVALLRTLELTITPMIGAVLGRTNGIAPGLEIDATLWKLELSSESEYVLDGSAPDESFFYNWSELSIRPVAWLSGGVVAQRTRFFREARIIEHGLLVGLTLGPFDLTAYVFDPFQSGRYYAFALAASL